MPNHLHIIWQQLNKNGKETPQGSFLKYTAHEFLKRLKATGESKQYEVYAANKKHEIWQRDSLSVEICSRSVAKQKLEYIHFNPVSGKWKLSKDDTGYYYSSARFYEIGEDDFGFLIIYIRSLMGIDVELFRVPRTKAGISGPFLFYFIVPRTKAQFYFFFRIPTGCKISLPGKLSITLRFISIF